MLKSTVFTISTVALIGLGSTMASAATLLEDDFSSGTLDPAWTQVGEGNFGWSVGPVNVGPDTNNRVSSNDIAAPVGLHTLTRDLSAPASSGWNASFLYGWRSYSGSSSARLVVRLMDASGDNGYGVYVQQNGYVEFQKYVGGAFAGGSVTAAKPNDVGILHGGGAEYRPMTLEWDTATGLSLYIGDQGDAPGSASTLLGTWSDTTHSALAFDQFQLWDRSINDARATFDNILVTDGVIPEPASAVLILAGGALLLSKRRHHQG